MKPLILVAGATGYVGGELLPALLAAGHPVRCLARHPDVLKAKGLPGLEVMAGDVLDGSSLRAAMAGVGIAYYLVHSMGSPQSFEEQDRMGAQNFANAAREAGVQRIIYLGGLGHSADQLSAHLRSRQEVGEILRSTGVPVIEFRASVVIGPGSLSFEMVRALVERFRSWLRRAGSLSQPSRSQSPICSPICLRPWICHSREAGSLKLGAVTQCPMVTSCASTRDYGD